VIDDHKQGSDGAQGLDREEIRRCDSLRVGPPGGRARQAAARNGNICVMHGGSCANTTIATKGLNEFLSRHRNHKNTPWHDGARNASAGPRSRIGGTGMKLPSSR
jgi:hypothetical protein